MSSSFQTSSMTKMLTTVTVGLGVSLLSTLLYRSYRKWRNEIVPKKWKRIGTLEQIFFYPIKSCAPIDLNDDIYVNCEVLGIRKGDIVDRSLLLIDEDGVVVTGRVYPKIVHITIKLIGKSKMIVSAPQMDDDLEIDLLQIKEEACKDVNVNIWGTVISAILCGERYDGWFSSYILGKGCGLRLAYYPHSMPVRQVQKSMRNGIAQPKDTGAFPDATSYHLINLSSVDELNTRLNKPIDGLQFRPNFFLKMDNPMPFAEDNWKWIRIGSEVLLRVVAPCARCIFININPFTAQRDADGNPLKMLRTYRKREGISGPIMGVNLGIRNTGFIKAHDVIYVEDE